MRGGVVARDSDESNSHRTSVVDETLRGGATLNQRNLRHFLACACTRVPHRELKAQTSGSTDVDASLRYCELRRGWRAESSHHSHVHCIQATCRGSRRDPASRREGSSARSEAATRGPCRVRYTSAAARRQWRTAGPMQMIGVWRLKSSRRSELKRWHLQSRLCCIVRMEGRTGVDALRCGGLLRPC
jgi:hypothetical protein